LSGKEKCIGTRNNTVLQAVHACTGGEREKRKVTKGLMDLLRSLA